MLPHTITYPWCKLLLCWADRAGLPGNCESLSVETTTYIRKTIYSLSSETRLRWIIESESSRDRGVKTKQYFDFSIKSRKARKKSSIPAEILRCENLSYAIGARCRRSVRDDIEWDQFLERAQNVWEHSKPGAMLCRLWCKPWMQNHKLSYDLCEVWLHSKEPLEEIKIQRGRDQDYYGSASAGSGPNPSARHHPQRYQTWQHSSDW